jgi:uncharacterized protein YdeI (BOF family)
MNLLKLSLIISLLGTLLLLFLSSLPPKLILIKNIKTNNLNKLIRIRGEIINSEKKNFYLLTLKDSSGQIQIIHNKNLSGKLEVIGKIKKYKNKTQIYPEKICYLKSSP